MSWESSGSLGYTNQTGKWLSASTTEHALTLYAATQMLKFGVSFNAIWGASGKKSRALCGRRLFLLSWQDRICSRRKKTGMDQSKETLKVSFACSMNVDRYLETRKFVN